VQKFCLKKYPTKYQRTVRIAEGDAFGDKIQDDEISEPRELLNFGPPRAQIPSEQ
jgi:hypothetical protein